MVEVDPGYVVPPEGGMGFTEIEPGFVVPSEPGALMGHGGVQLVGNGMGAYSYGDDVQLVGIGMTEGTKKWLTWGALFLSGVAVGVGGSMLIRR